MWAHLEYTQTIENLLEGMSFACFLNGLKHVLVDTEREGSQKGKQECVRNHRDDRKEGERQ